jgi:hypothetical protein
LQAEMVLSEKQEGIRFLCLNLASSTQFVHWITSSLLVSYTERRALKYS